MAPHTAQSDLITTGHEEPILDRFYYRSRREFVFKKTPQADLIISVYYPYDWTPSDRRAGILFLFGGGWSVGTREQFARQAAWLASRGMVAASADYRVREYHGTGVATCIEDAFDAMRWFRGHSDMLGLDPERIAAGGGSAGGHLAATLATMPEPDRDEGIPDISPRPNALVLYNPALNVFTRPEIGDFAVPEGQREQLEPLTYLDASLPPTWVWFGSDDRLLPLAQPFFDRAQALGCSVDLMLAQGADHGYFNDWEGHFEPALQAMGAFLQRLAYLA